MRRAPDDKKKHVLRDKPFRSRDTYYHDWATFSRGREIYRDETRVAMFCHIWKIFLLTITTSNLKSKWSLRKNSAPIEGSISMGFIVDILLALKVLCPRRSSNLEKDNFCTAHHCETRLFWFLTGWNFSKKLDDRNSVTAQKDKYSK